MSHGDIVNVALTLCVAAFFYCLSRIGKESSGAIDVTYVVLAWEYASLIAVIATIIAYPERLRLVLFILVMLSLLFLSIITFKYSMEKRLENVPKAKFVTFRLQHLILWYSVQESSNLGILEKVRSTSNGLGSSKKGS